jgi:hypothetical protein
MSLVSKQELKRRFGIEPYQFDNYLAAGMPVFEQADRDIGRPWQFDTDAVAE